MKKGNTKPAANIEYIQPPIPKRKDSFWYAGQVAIVKGKRTISIEAHGSIAVIFNPDEHQQVNRKAREIALKRNYTDRKLNSLNKHDGWSNNNWFAFYWVENDQFLEDTAGSYDEAIKTAIALSEVDAPIDEETAHAAIERQTKQAATKNSDTYTQQLETILENIKADVARKIEEKGKPSRWFMEQVIEIKNHSLQFHLDNGRYLEEVGVTHLHDDSGYQYQYEMLTHQQLAEVADYINKL